MRRVIAGHRRPSVLTTTIAAVVLAGAATVSAAFTVTRAQQGAPEPRESTTSSSTPTPELSELGPADVVEIREVGAVALQGLEGPERVDDIPLTALVAYQRAETIINTADRSCHVQWTLIAALGRVLTDHGERNDAHRIRQDGLVSPRLIGPALRSKDGRRVADTDAGELDGDRRHDRAVGPMLVDAPTWNMVGVDADGDGHRNPQDLDDAAVAAAVRLCSGNENLRQLDDRARALRRISNKQGFVDAVLTVAAAYEEDHRISPVPVVLPPLDPTELPDLPALTPSRASDPGGSRDVGPGTPEPGDQDLPGATVPDRPTIGTPTPSQPPGETESPSETPSDTPTDEPSGSDPPTDPSPTETPT